MFNLGGSEILVLAFLALILFGNKNLPSNMKKMVKGLNEAKKFANDAQRSWAEIRDDVTRQIMADDALEQAKKDIVELKKTLEQPLEKQLLDAPVRNGPMSTEDSRSDGSQVSKHEGPSLDEPTHDLSPANTVERVLSSDRDSLDRLPLAATSPDFKDDVTEDSSVTARSESEHGRTEQASDAPRENTPHKRDV